MVITGMTQNASDAAAQARSTAQDAAQQARNAAENARDIARAEREAAQAKRDAARADREAQQEQGGGTGTVTITKDGVTTVLTDASPEAIATALGMPNPRDGDRSNDQNDVPLMGIFMTAVVVIVAMVLRYRGRTRGASATVALPADLTERLSRMEAGIDATAVEVERISEGQRFTTRLLSERPVEEVRRG
jgi:hypothetical protein